MPKFKPNDKVIGDNLTPYDPLKGVVVRVLKRPMGIIYEVKTSCGKFAYLEKHLREQ